jgi:hypothetical protein
MQMIRRFMLAALSGLVAGAVLLSMAVVPASAATSKTGGSGLKVSPVTTSLTIKPGESQTVTLYVQNITSDTMTWQALINDFTAGNDESGAPALLLNNEFAPSHSLKRFVAPLSNITLQPGQQKGVNVVISIPDNATAGGYYGAVRFAPASVSGSGMVTLSASVGSLILVKVPGNIKEDLQLASLDVRQGKDGSPQTFFTSNKDLLATVRFQNKGDIQEQPFGKLLLKQGNKIRASYEVNHTTPLGNVLPSSIRKFSVSLDKVGVFGKYTLVGNFGYGSNGQLVSGQTTFYVVPVAMVCAVIAGILVILFLIFAFPKMVRAYNKRIIRKAGRR